MAVYDAVHARRDELGATLGDRAARLLWSEADRLRALALGADPDDSTAPR